MRDAWGRANAWVLEGNKQGKLWIQTVHQSFSFPCLSVLYLNSSSLNLKSMLKAHAPYTVLPFMSFQNLLLF